MLAATPSLAFGLPGYPELIVIGIVGLLIFGRRLPEVGRTVGKTITQLRRGLQDFKDQINRDEDLREARSTIHDIKQSVQHPVLSPQVMADPQRLFDQLTDESQASPGPDAQAVAPPPEQSVFETEVDKLASTDDR